MFSRKPSNVKRASTQQRLQENWTQSELSFRLFYFFLPTKCFSTRKKTRKGRKRDGIECVCFARGSSTAKRTNMVSVKSIAQHQMSMKGLRGKVTTASLHKLLPEDEQKLRDLQRTKAEEKNKALWVRKKAEKITKTKSQMTEKRHVCWLSRRKKKNIITTWDPSARWNFVRTLSLMLQSRAADNAFGRIHESSQAFSAEGSKSRQVKTSNLCFAWAQRNPETYDCNGFNILHTSLFGSVGL